MDRIVPARRSENMRRIRSKNTEPERRVRHVLSAARVHYRLHRRNLPGKPDVSIGRLRLAVFVHGCFWHQHSGCQRAFVPASHRSFWIRKFQANVARDVMVQEQLRAVGWRSQIIWECETKDEKELMRRVEPAILAYRKLTSR